MANGRGVRPKKCKQCGKPGTARAPISFRGNCTRCAEQATADAIRSMSAGVGAVHDKWRDQMARAIFGDDT